MSEQGTAFAVTAKEGSAVRLAMQRLWLTGRVLAAGAHLTVEHVFQSDEDKPLEVIYSFPLPRDAALRAFRITGENFEVESELKPTPDAVKVYEDAIAAGSLAVMSRQYGDGIVNLTVGNIRPKETVKVRLELLAGVELRDDGFRFRFPFTLAPGYHSAMRAAVTADGEGEIELPTDQFGDVILPAFRKDASGLHEVGFDVAINSPSALEEVGSPSHSVRVRQDGSGKARVTLATASDVPNRDLVLDVRFQDKAAQVFAGEDGDGRRVCAALVPSTLFGKQAETPRKVAILLDRSGSMQGSPIEQARKAIEACLAALGESDEFGIVAFDDRVEHLDSGLLRGSRENREKAKQFLQQVDARGGTELAAGFLAAAKMLDKGGDILILTDGQVMGTEEILKQARAAGIRLFCLGIGSASQDRFLALLARETGGVSRFVTPRERVDMAAVDLFASIGRPAASGLKTPDGVEPQAPESVFAGTPVLLFGEMSKSALELRWDGGSLSLPIPESTESGRTVRLLQGSRLITDWESRYPAEEAHGILDRRRKSRERAHLAELSKRFGLASREMSLVAVVKRADDRPGELPDTRVVPVGMPQDVQFNAYFPQQAPAPAAFMRRCKSMAPAGALQFEGSSKLSHADMAPSAPCSEFEDKEIAAPSKTDALLELAAMLEPDGGLPGANESERAARTVAAVLLFVSEGHTLKSGAFRSHVVKMVGFLKQASGLSEDAAEIVRRAVEGASTGRAPAGDWLALTRQHNWEETEKLFAV